MEEPTVLFGVGILYLFSVSVRCNFEVFSDTNKNKQGKFLTDLKFEILIHSIANIIQVINFHQTQDD